jgi:hypothetical protein
VAVSSLSTKSEGDGSHSESRDFQHGPDGSGEDVSQSQSKHVDLQDESVPQTADAKQPESAPTNVQDNFDEVGGDQEEYVNSGLASCSGQLAFLCDFLTECRILQRQVAADDVVNPFVVLPQMLDVVSKVADISKELVINCNQVLDNILKNGTIPDEEHTEKQDVVEVDPGLRKKITSDNQRRYLLQTGPFQPKLPRFPVNESIPKDKQCRFSSKWYQEYPHLEYSIEKDAAFCFVCCLFPEGVGRQNADPAWVTVGVRNWTKMKSVGKIKQGKLAQHFASQSHRSALEDFAHLVGGGESVDIMLDKKTIWNDTRRTRQGF